MTETSQEPKPSVEGGRALGLTHAFNDPKCVPQSWYAIARSRDVKLGQAASRELFGRRQVVYRSEAGVPAVLEARCPHLGADLAQGRVEGACLRCPFHNWSYDASGSCVDVPSQDAVPAFAKTFSYPTRERYGLIWIFNGPEPLFELPAFAEWDAELDLVPMHIRPKVLPVHPHVIACNGLDIQHFESIHDFTFHEPPELSEPDPYSVRVSMQVRVEAKNLFLRFLRLLAGDRVQAVVTVVGGNVAVIEAMAGPIPFLMFNTHAHVSRAEGGGFDTLSQTVLFNPRLAWWKRALGLQFAAKWLGIAIMIYLLRDDVHLLRRVQFRPRLIEADGALKVLIRQVNRLPVFAPPE